MKIFSVESISPIQEYKLVKVFSVEFHDKLIKVFSLESIRPVQHYNLATVSICGINKSYLPIITSQEKFSPPTHFFVLQLLFLQQAVKVVHVIMTEPLDHAARRHTPCLGCKPYALIPAEPTKI